MEFLTPLLSTPVRLLAWTLFTAALVTPAGSAAETGFRKEVRVAASTRLDWKFAVSGFGPKSGSLPADYDSRKQRYDLFVPAKYKADKAWPCVVFISPGDGPLGWTNWQKPCKKLGMFFCAPYGAGNSCPVGKRTRIVLDMLDDVRRHYRIDPEQTYLAGFSGGGRMACSIAFALPELFGGVVPVCGTNPMQRLSYLRQRVQDRLSVAFVTGESDFNRKENEVYMYPYLQELEVRARLWVVPKLGHGIPSGDVLTKVHLWLADDLKRRRADVKSRPTLALGSDQALTGEEMGAKLLQAAEAELKVPERTWRGVALLQGVVARWGKTKAAIAARKRLEELLADPQIEKRIADQGADEEQKGLIAQAKAMERFGQPAKALDAWRLLAKLHPDTPAGKKAAEAIKRLED
jgi:pimeloyl-ACP methyl ester carboxylesterase